MKIEWLRAVLKLVSFEELINSEQKFKDTFLG